jgi:hypothetical protein
MIFSIVGTAYLLLGDKQSLSLTVRLLEDFETVAAFTWALYIP